MHVLSQKDISQFLQYSMLQTGTAYIFTLYSKCSHRLEILTSHSLQSKMLCVPRWNKFSLQILFLWKKLLIVVCSQMQAIVLCQSIWMLKRWLRESLEYRFTQYFFCLIASIPLIILKFSEISVTLNGHWNGPGLTVNRKRNCS